MPNTTDIALDYGKATACEHCGAVLPARVYRPLGTGTPVILGFEPCDCESARAEREAAQKAEEERAGIMQERDRLEAQERAGIPARYRDVTHPRAHEVAVGITAGSGYYIHGSNGTGKTMLAMAAAILLIEQERNVCVASAYELMDAMRSRKDEDRALFNRACTCDVLVLDDLGKEASNTAYACERLFAIVDIRDKDMLPTIVTSNYRLSEIAQKITEGAVGVAIASRLRGSCKLIGLEGKDRRLNVHP